MTGVFVWCRVCPEFGVTDLAVIARWQFYTASQEAAFEGDGYEAPWDFWRRGEALLRWGSGGANDGVVAVMSDRSGEFIERGGDTHTFVDCFYTELIVPAAQVLDERVPRITTDAVRSRCKPRIGLSRAFNRP